MPVEIEHNAEAQDGHLREEREQLHPPRDPSSTRPEPDEEAVHSELAYVEDETDDVETMTDPLVEEVHRSDRGTMECAVIFRMEIRFNKSRFQTYFRLAQKPPLFKIIEKSSKQNRSDTYVTTGSESLPQCMNK